MRAESLQARSIAFLEASIVGGFIYVCGLLAFARLWGLMVTEEWLVPLVVMMGVQFLAGCVVAHSRRILTRETVVAELTVKALIVLAYVAGFAVQRMFEPNGRPRTDVMGSFGHATAGALIGFEFLRIVRIYRSVGLKLGPFESALVWFDRTFAAEVRRQEIQDVADESRRQGARVERIAACEELRKSGEIKSSPFIETIDPDGTPAEAPKPDR